MNKDPIKTIKAAHLSSMQKMRESEDYREAARRRAQAFKSRYVQTLRADAKEGLMT